MTIKRKPVIAANWKMYKSKDEALEFIFKVTGNIPDRDMVESIIFPPAILLNLLVKREGEHLRIGAQNIHYAEEGAFTGENSPMHVVTAGAEYILVGHSERRTHFNETNEMVNLKLLSALKHGLVPIVCVGEPLEVKEEGNTIEYIGDQIEKAFMNVEIKNPNKIIIAYEPIWAIGTGKTAKPAEINEVIRYIRGKIAKLYSEDVAQKIRILYGGSVKTTNIKDIIVEPEIDGVLIGGAALDPDNFIYFTKVAKELETIKKE